MNPLGASRDETLVKASLAGDREAFEQIVSRHQALICSLAYSGTGNLPQSEDLAQETFIAAWKHLAELREPAKLRFWLCGIARNLINNSVRKQRREPSHRAEALESIVEPRSPEPLPAERAISREEAEILWRALERIPETYREPLVLFYREHQSVEAVAQELELTEDAVRQRLTRGRRLLQDEVLAFVEGALEKTRPGLAFTVMVVAALPFAATSAKAASIGIAAAKGGAGAKSAFSLVALGSSAAMLGAMLFSWKTAVDETRSPRERRLMVRTAWFQIAFLLLSMGATFYCIPQLSQHPVAAGAALALLLVGNIVNAVALFDYLGRRRIEIMMEEGSWADAEWSGPGKETDRKALRKTVKLTVPLLLMFAAGGVGLPWKQHWIRSAIVVAGEGLVLVWGFRRFYRMLSFRFMPGLNPSKFQTLSQNPLLLMPAIAIGAALIGAGLPLFLNPDGAAALLHHSSWPPNMGLWLLAVLAAYGVFAVIYVKKRGLASEADPAFDKSGAAFSQSASAKTVTRLLGSPLLMKTLAATTKLMGPLMRKMMLKTYAPVFEQLDLSPEQRARLTELILKKNAVNMDKGMALMNGKLDAPRRAALIEEMKNGRVGCDADIRQLLGEENYQTFESFEKTIPDRLVLGMFKSKAASVGAPLSEAQQDQLLQAVSQARAQYPWTTDLSRRTQNPADPVAMFNEENIATFAREEEDFDRQFLTEAQRVLTAGQLSQLGPFLAKQRHAKVASMKMTAKMLAPPGS